MYFNNIDERKQVSLDGLEGVDGIKIQWLLSPEAGTPNFEMRYFEIKKGGVCRKERHPWEHEAFVLKGKGTVIGENGERIVKEGDAIYVAPNELHQFKSAPDEDFCFICCVLNGAEDEILNEFKPKDFL